MWNIFVIVLMISICEACGQSMAFLAHKKQKILLLLLSLFFYLFVIYFLYRAYAYKGVGYINILWSGMTTLLMIAIGYLFLNERFSIIEWIGAGFILIGMSILISTRKV